MTRSVELKLYAYRKNRDGLIISFVVHPNDEQQLLGIDIGDTFDAVLNPTATPDQSSLTVGTDDRCATASRLRVREGDRQVGSRSDGARDGSSAPLNHPEKPERTPGPAPSDVPFGHRGPTDGERIRTRAVMLCKDVDFQDWIGVAASVGSTEADHEREAARELCAYLGIVSRKALADNLDAQKRFLLLEAHYHAERRGG
jgi:hypothetical protein